MSISWAPTPSIVLAVVGRVDHELPWADTFDAFVEHDEEVLASDKPDAMRESVHKSAKDGATLNVCKFTGELDGVRCFVRHDLDH